MKKISATIVADSIGPSGDRITSMLVTFPRFILAELNTHRLFSKNSASSRAIPFKTMLESIANDPFIPIAWQKEHSGMQGTEYFEDEEIVINGEIANIAVEWLKASNLVVLQAKRLNECGVTKQLCNRLFEPFLWHTVLVTATEWDNFFNLRCPKYEVSWYPSNRPEALEPTQATFNSQRDAGLKTEGECFDWTRREWRESNSAQAEIHMQALAEAMWDALHSSTPKQLEAGEWHIPFGDNMDVKELVTERANQLIEEYSSPFDATIPTLDMRAIENGIKIKIATARCARLSYMTFDKQIDYKKDIELYDRLRDSEHMSPFEHCARAMTLSESSRFIKGPLFTTKVPKTVKHPTIDGIWVYPKDLGWCNNFKGFIQQRYLLDNPVFR